ncbi:MAG: TolC family protein [Thermoanaerobaculia bacterium]|nr:TolC family protein [Thermoanaerobaculia bacterium]
MSDPDGLVRSLQSSFSDTIGVRREMGLVTLVGSGGRLSDEVEDLLNEDFSVWNLAGGLLAPIFQGGRLRAAADLAAARRDEALAIYVGRALAAFAEVEGSLAAERFLAERRDALEAATRETERAQRLAEQQYAAGLVDFLTVLETQRRALSSRVQLLTAQRQLLDARVDLHLALGGGWEPPEDDSAVHSPVAETVAPEESSS